MKPTIISISARNIEDGFFVWDDAQEKSREVIFVDQTAYGFIILTFSDASTKTYYPTDAVPCVVNQEV